METAPILCFGEVVSSSRMSSPAFAKSEISGSRSNIKVGFIQSVVSFVFFLVMGAVFFVVFAVIGWSGIIGWFSGNIYAAVVFSVTLVIIVVLVSLWGIGWASKVAVGVR